MFEATDRFRFLFFGIYVPVAVRERLVKRGL